MKQQLHVKREFTDVRHLLEWAGDTYAGKTAFSFRVKPNDKEITKVSYTAFRDDVRALASELLSMGCAGEHVALIGKCSYEWITLYYATLSIGAILVPLDRECRHQGKGLHDSRDKRVFRPCGVPLRRG